MSDQRENVEGFCTSACIFVVQSSKPVTDTLVTKRRMAQLVVSEHNCNGQCEQDACEQADNNNGIVFSIEEGGSEKGAVFHELY